MYFVRQLKLYFTILYKLIYFFFKIRFNYFENVPVNVIYNNRQNETYKTLFY